MGSDTPIPIPSVNEAIMLLVKEYAEYKVEFPNPPPSEDKKDERRTDDILPWDKEFMNKLQQSVLFDLIMVCGVAFAFFLLLIATVGSFF